MTSDVGLTIGSTLLAIRDDVETTVQINRELGFGAMEVHGSHLGVGFPNVPVLEAHARAIGRLIRGQGLAVSTLNVAGDPSFNPFVGEVEMETTIEGLARHLRWADALGAPRVLFWDGMIKGKDEIRSACTTLQEVIQAARERSEIETPPQLTCELHPFTFALMFRAIEELADALKSVGAGLCVDFCHFGVGLKGDILASLTPSLVSATNLLHYSDTDFISSEVHFPPSEGKLDLEAIAGVFEGAGIPVAWDLFSWPAARTAVGEHMEKYMQFLQRVSGVPQN